MAGDGDIVARCGWDRSAKATYDYWHGCCCNPNRGALSPSLLRTFESNHTTRIGRRLPRFPCPCNRRRNHEHCRARGLDCPSTCGCLFLFSLPRSHSIGTSKSIDFGLGGVPTTLQTTHSTPVPSFPTSLVWPDTCGLTPPPPLSPG